MSCDKSKDAATRKAFWYTLVGVWITLTFLVLVTGCVSGSVARYQWTRVEEIHDVSIEVQAVELRELSALMEKHRAVGSGRVLPAMTRNRLGFSVLVSRDGDYYCTIYVTDEMDVETVQHEKRHCYGWSHE